MHLAEGRGACLLRGAIYQLNRSQLFAAMQQRTKRNAMRPTAHRGWLFYTNCRYHRWNLGLPHWQPPAMPRLRDPITGRLVKTTQKRDPKKARSIDNSVAKRKLAEKARALAMAEAVGPLLPDDYTGEIPIGLNAALLPGQTFAVPGGRIPVERGTKTGKLSKTNRQLEWRTALDWGLKNYQTSTVERGAVLRAIAISTIDRAVKGDKDAVAEIANRLDGKAVQQVEVQSTEDRTITIIHRTE